MSALSEEGWKKAQQAAKKAEQQEGKPYYTKITILESTGTSNDLSERTNRFVFAKSREEFQADPSGCFEELSSILDKVSGMAACLMYEANSGENHSQLYDSPQRAKAHLFDVLYISGFSVRANSAGAPAYRH